MTPSPQVNNIIQTVKQRAMQYLLLIFMSQGRVILFYTNTWC